MESGREEKFENRLLGPTNYLEETRVLNNFLQRPISLWFWIVSNPIRVVD